MSRRIVVANVLLRRARLACPSPWRPGHNLSRSELATAVNDLLHRGRVLDVDIDAGYIGKLEAGRYRWPRSPQRRWALRTVLGAGSDEELGFYPTRASRGDAEIPVSQDGVAAAATHPAGLEADEVPVGDPGAGGSVASAGSDAGTSPAPAADRVILRLTHDAATVVVPLSRRALARAGIGPLVEAFGLDKDADVLRDVVERPDLAQRLTINSPAHLHEILVHLREQWHALVRTDNLLGPRFALAGVLNQISAIEGLLPSVRDSARREVVGLGARYAESAAWLWEDTGNLAQARYWTGRAMEWAYEAGDHAMLAWTVARRAQQAAAARDAGQAIGLVQAARGDEAKLGRPMRAALRVQEAYGHALDGDEHTCLQLLDQAHRWAAHDTVGDAREGHGSYCTAGYIELQRAACWLVLGQPTNAIRLYETALPTLPVVYQRDRAAALTGLAAAYAANRQVEQAASVAHQALPVARAAGSQRIVGEIMAVSADLVQHRPLPAVAALLDDLSAGDG